MTHEEAIYRIAELRGTKPREDELKKAIEMDEKEEALCTRQLEQQS